MGYRRKPAGVVVGKITEGVLNLPEDCARAASVAGEPFKFTLTSPYMLARTLLDEHYHDPEKLTLAIADALAAHAINRVLDAFRGQKAVHLCFGNYGGETIQSGTWAALISFLNRLHADHLVLELAHRPASDLEALRAVDPRVGLGIGVVDIKVNHVETAEEVARALERSEQVLGPGRVRYVHPDGGFWMLKRSVADRKIAALVKGRDLYLGRGAAT